MRLNRTHLIMVLSLLFSPVCQAAQISSTFSVMQSQGIELNPGDEVRVRISVNAATQGVEGRGMAGTPEIRYTGAVTSVSISAGDEQFDFTQPLDVIVSPLQNQWTAAWIDMASGTAPPTESKEPVLQAMTLVFRYREPEELPLDSPVPPSGAITAEQSAVPRFGLDLMVRGHYGDRRDGWSIMAKFQSMSTQD